MQAGQLDRRITIETVAETQDDAGGLNRAWSTHATVWARITDAGAREALAGGREQGWRESIFVIRYLSTLTHKMRFSYGGVAWEVENIKVLGRNKWMEVLARAKVA